MQHKVIVYFEPWMNAYRAYSDSLGADCSPYGDGKTEEDAKADLQWQLDEMEEKKNAK